MIKDEDLLFYDIECFEYDSFVCFKDIDNNIVDEFWNNRERVQAEIEGGFPLDIPSGFQDMWKVIKGKILVGYNNYNYDDQMLARMLNESTKQSILYAANNSIIHGNGIHPVTVPFKSLDTMQQIDLSHPSLKQIEGNMGKSIIESSIPFDIGRPLTDEERRETEKYCRYDVENTIEVYKLRKKSYFEPKEGLIQMLPEEERERFWRKNTTSISAQILTKGKETELWRSFKIPDRFWNESFRKSSGIEPKVWDLWDSIEKIEQEQIRTGEKPGKGKSVKQHTEFGDFVFGLGGLHGVPHNPVGIWYDCDHADVKSMYPSAIYALGALEDIETYDGIRRERIRIKHIDPIRAAALKLILNSVYGNFKNKFSFLYNPLASSSVCIYGQIALFTLCKRLYESGYTIINANTDGVVYNGNGHDADTICKEWEQEFTGFSLDIDHFKKWIQRDVNNYIAIENDGTITYKGGEVNKVDKDKFFGNNNTRIVQIAMAERLITGRPLIDILIDHENEPYLWQYVLKVGSTFKGTIDESGNYMDQKVNRIFAASQKCELETTKLYKAKENPNDPKDDPVRINFPDTPERMILWNDDTNLLPDFERNVDITWYLNLVQQKLKGWPDVH